MDKVNACVFAASYFTFKIYKIARKKRGGNSGFYNYQSFFSQYAYLSRYFAGAEIIPENAFVVQLDKAIKTGFTPYVYIL